MLNGSWIKPVSYGEWNELWSHKQKWDIYNKWLFPFPCHELQIKTKFQEYTIISNELNMATRMLIQECCKINIYDFDISTSLMLLIEIHWNISYIFPNIQWHTRCLIFCITKNNECINFVFRKRILLYDIFWVLNIIYNKPCGNIYKIYRHRLLKLVSQLIRDV